MGRCIFCKSVEGPFQTREHILPESLGGGEWAVLPPGLFCDRCQNHFGSSVEQQALDDYPFNLVRVFLGIPTKKRKLPWMKSWEGKICASPVAGRIHLEPEPAFVQAIEDGTKTQLRILAHPLKPNMVCRTLLKMAIETIAFEDPTAAFDEKLDLARTFALTGNKSGEWWYLQIENHSLASDLIRGMPVHPFEPTALELCDIGDGAEVFHLRLFFIDMIVPMENRVVPALDDLPEPEYRLFRI
ncbi:MAG TPA: HNH endonuclease [Pirellulales bacterium]|jgi:hypothetical protein|nr:HNH endonuclease [Pirellulales bacterium]